MGRGSSESYDKSCTGMFHASMEVVRAAELVRVHAKVANAAICIRHI
jgi:hypothetical protein